MHDKLLDIYGMFQVFNGRVPSQHKLWDTNLVHRWLDKIQLISALLRHNHSHRKAGLQFDIRASKVCPIEFELLDERQATIRRSSIRNRYICIHIIRH